MKYKVFGFIRGDRSRVGIDGLMVSVYEANQAANISNAASLPDDGSLEVIGTAISGDRGDFELNFDDSAVRDGNERKPDLLIGVFAPLRYRPGSQEPMTPQERLLFFAGNPRMEAGTTEGYVILIDEERLKELGMIELQPDIGTGETVGNLIRNSFNKNRAFKQEVRRATSGAIKENAKKKISAGRKASTFSFSFSPLKRESDVEKTFRIVDDGRPGGRRARIKRVITEARDEGIRRLSEIEPRKLILDVPDIRTILDVSGASADLATPISVTFGNICEIIRQAVGGLSLERTRDLRNAADRLRELRGTDHDGDDDGLDGGDDSEGTLDDIGTTLEPAATAAARIQRLVEKQVADIPISPDESEDLPSLPLEKIRAELERAEIASGPADTTAYHDFHAVQIAYPSVWAESVHEDYAGLIRLAYEAVNRVETDTGLTEAGDRVLNAEIENIEGFVRAIGERADALEDSERDGIHPDVVFFFPELEPIWPTINRNYQTWITRQLTESLGEDRSGNPLTPRSCYGAAWASGIYTLEGFDAVYPGSVHGIATEAFRRVMSVRNTVATLSELLTAPDGDDVVVESYVSEIGRLRRLLTKLSNMLGTEPYSFEYYAEESYNFGIVATYRQKWEPGTYQVGDMVSTVPLAPGERRNIKVKETVRSSRAVKEMERASWSNEQSRSSTARFSEEVIRRAETATNFEMNSQGSFSIGQIGSIQVSSGFQASQSTFSQGVKKNFREAVISASHAFRNERSLEVSSDTFTEREATTTAELFNPNNEIPVTYLLYELERQYKVHEKLHRLQPIILIAQPMPKPSEIDEAWLVRHEWILRRVLLDDTLRGALDQLHNSFAADEVGIAVVRANWETQDRIVQELNGENARWATVRERLNKSLVEARYAERQAEARQDAGGLLYDIGSALAAFDPIGMDEGIIEAKRKMLEEQMEWANAELQRNAEKLNSAREALNQATSAYTDALRERTQQRLQVDQLRIHVKDNILYYMQAIWAHEPSDQRYFRLHQVEIHLPQAESTTCTVREAIGDEVGHPIPGLPPRRYVIEGCSVSGLTFNTKELHEVAEIDRPLGYKGNYIMFPLKECTTVTDFMLLEYVDSYLGIRDPDLLSDFTTDELMEYRNALDEAEKVALDRLIAKRLSGAGVDEETIVVPSGQLYMEALVGTHTLLEPFKLAHRGYDAAAAREELRRRGLENLRYAMRMVSEEPDLDDPDVDKRVEITGNTNVEVETDDG